MKWIPTIIIFLVCFAMVMAKIVELNELFLSTVTWNFYYAGARAGLVEFPPWVRGNNDREVPVEKIAIIGVKVKGELGARNKIPTDNEHFLRGNEKEAASTRKNTRGRLIGETDLHDAFVSDDIVDKNVNINDKLIRRRGDVERPQRIPRKTRPNMMFTTSTMQRYKSKIHTPLRIGRTATSVVSPTTTTTATFSTTITVVSTPIPSSKGDFCPINCGESQCFCNSDAQKPFCFVNASGFACDSVSTVGWHIDKTGLTFINSALNSLKERCNTFVPPVKDTDRQNLINLLSVTTYGEANKNVSGIWTNPFDFIGDCNKGFYCDTGDTYVMNQTQPSQGTCREKLGLNERCRSANQCNTQRCVNQSDLNLPGKMEGAIDKNVNTSTFICARLTDEILPFMTPGASNQINGLDIALLCVGSVLIAFFVIFAILWIRRICASRQRGRNNNNGEIDEATVYMNPSEKPAACFLERFCRRPSGPRPRKLSENQQNYQVPMTDGAATNNNSNNDGLANNEPRDTFARWNFGKNFVAKHLSALRLSFGENLTNLRFSIRPHSSTNNGDMQFSIVPGDNNNNGGTGNDERVREDADGRRMRSSLLTSTSESLSVLLPPPPSLHNMSSVIRHGMNETSQDNVFKDENVNDKCELNKDTLSYSSIGIYSAGYTSGTSNGYGFEYSTLGELYSNFNSDLSDGNMPSTSKTKSVYDSYNSCIRSSGIGSVIVDQMDSSTNENSGDENTTHFDGDEKDNEGDREENSNEAEEIHGNDENVEKSTMYLDENDKNNENNETDRGNKNIDIDNNSTDIESDVGTNTVSTEIKSSNSNQLTTDRSVQNNLLKYDEIFSVEPLEDLEYEEYLTRMKLYEGLQLINEMLMEDGLQQEESEGKESLQQQLQEIERQEMEAEERERELDAIKLPENQLRELERLSTTARDRSFVIGSGKRLSSKMGMAELTRWADLQEEQEDEQMKYAQDSGTYYNSDDSDAHGKAY